MSTVCGKCSLSNHPTKDTLFPGVGSCGCTNFNKKEPDFPVKEIPPPKNETEDDGFDTKPDGGDFKEDNGDYNPDTGEYEPGEYDPDTGEWKPSEPKEDDGGTWAGGEWDGSDDGSWSGSGPDGSWTGDGGSWSGGTWTGGNGSGGSGSWAGGSHTGGSGSWSGGTWTDHGDGTGSWTDGNNTWTGPSSGWHDNGDGTGTWTGGTWTGGTGGGNTWTGGNWSGGSNGSGSGDSGGKLYPPEYYNPDGGFGSGTANGGNGSGQVGGGGWGTGGGASGVGGAGAGGEFCTPSSGCVTAPPGATTGEGGDGPYSGTDGLGEWGDGTPGESEDNPWHSGNGTWNPDKGEWGPGKYNPETGEWEPGTYPEDKVDWDETNGHYNPDTGEYEQGTWDPSSEEWKPDGWSPKNHPKDPCVPLATTPGSGATTTTKHWLGGVKGIVEIDYDMYGYADAMDVYYKDELVASTNGRVANKGTLSFKFDPIGTDYEITVVVSSDTGGTSWEYYVNCPYPDPDDPPNPDDEDAHKCNPCGKERYWGTSDNEREHFMGQWSGTVNIPYKFYEPGGAISVEYGGQVVASTNGNVVGEGELTFDFHPTPSHSGGDMYSINVKITTVDAATKWIYQVFCPFVPTTEEGCGVDVQSEGATRTITNHEVGLEKGRIRISYDMGNNADQLVVRYNGRVISSTNGFVTGKGELSFKYLPIGSYNNKIEVVVDSQTPNVNWSYSLECPVPLTEEDEASDSPAGPCQQLEKVEFGVEPYLVDEATEGIYATGELTASELMAGKEFNEIGYKFMVKGRVDGSGTLSLIFTKMSSSYPYDSLNRDFCVREYNFHLLKADGAKEVKNNNIHIAVGNSPQTFYSSLSIPICSLDSTPGDFPNSSGTTPCGEDIIMSKGETETRNKHILGPDPGYTVINYNLGNTAKSISVIYNGQTLKTKKGVGISTIEFNYEPVNGIEEIEVVVKAMDTNDKWGYRVNCPEKKEECNLGTDAEGATSLSYFCDGSVDATAINTAYWEIPGRNIVPCFFPGMNQCLKIFDPADKRLLVNAKDPFYNYLWKLKLGADQGTVQESAIKGTWLQFLSWAKRNLPCRDIYEYASMYMTYHIKIPVLFFKISALNRYFEGNKLDYMIKYMNKTKPFCCNWISFQEMQAEPAVGAYNMDPTDRIPGLEPFESYINIEPSGLDFHHDYDELGPCMPANLTDPYKPWDFINPGGTELSSPMWSEGVPNPYKKFWLDVADYERNLEAFTCAQVIVHEMGHAIDSHMFSKVGERLSLTSEWMSISGFTKKPYPPPGQSQPDPVVKSRGIHRTSYRPVTDTGREAPVSQYGCTCAEESFAEAYRMYIFNPYFLERMYPQQFRFMEKHVKPMTS